MKYKAVFIACLLVPVFIVSSGFNYSPQHQKKAQSVIEYPWSKGELSFPEFLSHFEKFKMPFEVQLTDLSFQKISNAKTRVHKKTINGSNNGSLMRTKYIPELSMPAFSRTGPPKIEALARFYPNGENGKSIAVIYKSHHPYNESNESYNLMVYDLKGNIIFPKPIEDHGRLYEGFQLAAKTLRKTTTCYIDASGNIERKIFRNEWKDDIKKVSFMDSEIVSYILTETENYAFDEIGIAQKLEDTSVNSLAASK